MIVAGLLVARKYWPTSWNPALRPPTARLRRIEALSLGPKRQIVLIQCDQTVICLGVHEHGMTVLTTTPVPLTEDPTGNEVPSATAPAVPASLTIAQWLSEHPWWGRRTHE